MGKKLRHTSKPDVRSVQYTVLKSHLYLKNTWKTPGSGTSTANPVTEKHSWHTGGQTLPGDASWWCLQSHSLLKLHRSSHHVCPMICCPSLLLRFTSSSSALSDPFLLSMTQSSLVRAMQCPVLPAAATRQRFVPIRWDGISAASNFYLLHRSLFSTVTYEENHPVRVLQVHLEWSHRLCRPTEMHRLRFYRANGPADHIPELWTLITGHPITLFSWSV